MKQFGRKNNHLWCENSVNIGKNDKFSINKIKNLK